jgi:hypothetical protein
MGQMELDTICWGSSAARRDEMQTKLFRQDLFFDEDDLRKGD